MSFAVIKGEKVFFNFFQANYPAFSDGCCVQPSLIRKTLSFCRIFTCKTQLDAHKNLQMHTNVTDVCGKVTSKCSCISSILQTAFVTALHEKNMVRRRMKSLLEVTFVRYCALWHFVQ